jgi:hypothetical protein
MCRLWPIPTRSIVDVALPALMRHLWELAQWHRSDWGGLELNECIALFSTVEYALGASLLRSRLPVTNLSLKKVHYRFIVENEPSSRKLIRVANNRIKLESNGLFTRNRSVKSSNVVRV